MAHIDWSTVPSKTITLFYPGQSSYQWLRSSKHKRAYKKTAQGEACLSCHEGEEIDIGNLIVSGDRLEPNPIPGKEGVKDLNVQALHDSEYLYFRFQYKSQLNREGRMLSWQVSQHPCSANIGTEPSSIMIANRSS